MNIDDTYEKFTKNLYKGPLKIFRKEPLKLLLNLNP